MTWTNHSEERDFETDRWTNKHEKNNISGILLAKLKLAQPVVPSRFKHLVTSPLADAKSTRWTLRSLELESSKEDERDSSEVIKAIRAQEFGTGRAEMLHRNFKPILTSSSDVDTDDANGARGASRERVGQNVRKTAQQGLQTKVASAGRDVPHSESLQRQSRTPSSLNPFSWWRSEEESPEHVSSYAKKINRGLSFEDEYVSWSPSSKRRYLDSSFSSVSSGRRYIDHSSAKGKDNVMVQ